MKFKKNYKSLLKYKTQLGSIKNIEKRNVAFHALSKKERRQEIALDVLGLLDMGRLSSSGQDIFDACYWSGKMKREIIDTDSPESMQELVISDSFYEEVSCSVCARGAMMLSTIRMGNNLSPTGIDLASGSIYSQKHFTTSMFKKMETVFEQLDGVSRVYQSNTNESLANIFLQVVQTGSFKLSDTKDYLSIIAR